MTASSIAALSRSAVLLISLNLSAPAGAQQSQATPPADASGAVLQELVTEVRQLRLALERTNSVSARLQITLQRIQMQQNQVNRIAGQLESMRGEITRSEAEQAQISGNVEGLESRLEQEQNPNAQKQLQEQQKFIKTLLIQKSRAVQDARAREAELTSSLQAEQSKLNELEAHLDSLEKLVEPQQTR